MKPQLVSPPLYTTHTSPLSVRHELHLNSRNTPICLLPWSGIEIQPGAQSEGRLLGIVWPWRPRLESRSWSIPLLENTTNFSTAQSREDTSHKEISHKTAPPGFQPESCPEKHDPGGLSQPQWRSASPSEEAVIAQHPVCYGYSAPSPIRCREAGEECSMSKGDFKKITR